MTFDPETYLDQAAALAGLTIDPAWREGVLGNLVRNVEIARRVMEFPLPDDLEAGPVFRP